MSVDVNLEPMQMETRGLTERRMARVEEHLAAENAQDLDAIMATFDRDPTYEVEAEAVVHEGYDGVRDFYVEATTAAPDLHIVVRNRHVTDQAILLEVLITGTHLGPFRGLPATGRRLEYPLCAVYTFREGSDRIKGERIYFDRVTLLQQLGVMSDPNSAPGKLTMLLTHPGTFARAAIRSVSTRMRLKPNP